MKELRISTRFLICVLLFGSVVPGVASSGDLSGDMDDVNWTRLTFFASKLFLDATTTIDLHRVDGKELEKVLMPAPAGHRAVDSPAMAWRISLESSFAGRRSRDEVLFDPGQGTALQRFKRKYGSKPYQKTQRFLDTGVYSLRQAPETSDQAKLGVAEWTKVGGSMYEHPRGFADCSVVLDPSVLLYWLSARVPELGTRTRVCVFSKKTFVILELEAQATTSIRVDYAEKQREHVRQHSRETEVLRVLLRPLAAAGADDTFEFLGLEGDVVVFLELSSRLPVQVSGRLPIVGGIDIKLIEADLEPSQQAAYRSPER